MEQPVLFADRQDAGRQLAERQAHCHEPDLLVPVPQNLVCLKVRAGFQAAGQYGADFSQVSDDEVIAALQRAAG